MRYNITKKRKLQDMYKAFMHGPTIRAKMVGADVHFYSSVLRVALLLKAHTVLHHRVSLNESSSSAVVFWIRRLTC